MKKFTVDHFKPQHFAWSVEGKVVTIALNRPDRKNPLTFQSYGELRDVLRDLVYCPDIKAVVLTGQGGNFCSGGDVHEIIGPLVQTEMPGLLEFTRMTGDLVKAMRACPQPIVAAIDGVCTGAGAMIACASDIRLAGNSTSFVAHYNQDWTHLGVGKDSPCGRPAEQRPGATSNVVSLPRVGGLHHRYAWRQAA